MTHRPRKRFGQNFLKDTNTITRLLALFDARQNDHVVEIGPGQGALTDNLAKTVQRLDIIEIDRDLGEQLQHRFDGCDHVHVHVTDVLKFDFRSIANSDRLRIIGNIPYNITSPILFHLMDYFDIIDDIQLLIQKEVAQRLAAPPGGKTYGRLSVMTQLFAHIEKHMDVSAHCFFPKPKVDSAVVHLHPKTAAEIPPYNKKVLAAMVRDAFSQRRKTLRNALKQYVDDNGFKQLNIDPQARPETLTPQCYAGLSCLSQPIHP